MYLESILYIKILKLINRNRRKKLIINFLCLIGCEKCIINN